MTLPELIQRIQELEVELARADVNGEVPEKIRTDVLSTLVLCRMNLSCAEEREPERGCLGFARRRMGKKGLN